MSANHAQSPINQVFSDTQPANYYRYPMAAADLPADPDSRSDTQLVADITPLANYSGNRNTGRHSSRCRLHTLKMLQVPDSPAKALTAT
ncbi:MAG: hypothetical protein WEB02_05300 [Methylophaga sp.]